MTRNGQVLPKISSNWKYLDTKEVALHAGYLRGWCRSKPIIIQRLTKKIKTLRKEMDVSDKFITHLNSALAYAMNNKAALGESIASGLLELPREEAGDDYDLTKATTKQLVDYIAESTDINVSQLRGHRTWSRYSPYLMDLAVNLYL